MPRQIPPSASGSGDNASVKRLIARLLPLLAAIAVAGCGGSSSVDEVWWPPEQPRQPERLTLLDPDAPAGEAWWAANVMAQLPTSTYATLQQRDFAAGLLAEVNLVRARYGLPAVEPLDTLNRVAQAHALDEAVRDYWSHHTPEGLTSRQRVHAAGGGTVAAGGENSSIGHFGQTTPAGVVYSWEHHSGHRELLLNADVRYMGAGAYGYSSGEFAYFVALLVSFE